MVSTSSHRINHGRLLLAMLILAFGFIAFSLPVAANEVDELDLVFSANRFGQVPPCPCKTKDRGGVAYEAALYDEIFGPAAVAPLKLDAGYWGSTADAPDQQGIQTHHLLEALETMQFDALNVGRSDLVGLTQSARSAGGSAELSLISANIYNAGSDEPAFATSRTVRRTLSSGREVIIGITGAASIEPGAILGFKDKGWAQVEPAGDGLSVGEYRIAPPEPALARQIEALRPKVEILIVLFAGGLNEATEIAELHPEIDYLVATGHLRDPEMRIQRVGPVVVLRPDNLRGREIGRLRIASEVEGVWELTDFPDSWKVTLDRKENEAVKSIVDAYHKAGGE